MAATITGNPQNMIVGAVAQIPYTAFAVALTPVAFAGIVLVIILLAVLYRAEFRRPAQLAPKPSSPRLHKPQMMKAVLVALGVVPHTCRGLFWFRRGARAPLSTAVQGTLAEASSPGSAI